MANIRAFADQELSTNSSWANRRHYSLPQFKRWDAYDGPLRDMPEEKAHAMLRELLEYFCVDGIDGFPLPPVGLPGTRNSRQDHNSPAFQLIMIGYSYFLAAARGRSRTMDQQWDAALYLLNKTEDAAREALINEVTERERARARAVEKAKARKPVLVYFIASESGPIKIGMAANPDARRKELQTSHHERLEILATCKGGHAKEQEYHRQFATHRLHGEWFERCPEIEAEIERLQTLPLPTLAGGR